SSLPDLGDHENVLKLILHEAGVISELIDSHRVFVEPMDLVRFEPQDFDVTVQTFFQQRAFAYVNTGGDVLEKRFRDFAEGSNLYEINSNDDKNRIYALLMGVRNGVSKQFDQFVLEKLSRDTMNRANGNSSLPPIVIQPLSCPIRFESLLLRLDGNQIEPMKTDIVLSPDTILDLPADIAERINAFRESGQDIRETAVRFRDVFDQRPELEAVFQMKEPFPATVYMKKESQ
ncbi:MAG: hypothetical protein KDB00_15890, partial [Planctomycetales bacterium]|nr:hypothetical protein [Planctomycetales bacterium]